MSDGETLVFEAVLWRWTPQPPAGSTALPFTSSTCRVTGCPLAALFSRLVTLMLSGGSSGPISRHSASLRS